MRLNLRLRETLSHLEFAMELCGYCFATSQRVNTRFLFKIFCKIYIVIVWTSGLIFLKFVGVYIKVKSARIGKFYNIIL
jgi:hypothetical protein